MENLERKGDYLFDKETGSLDVFYKCNPLKKNTECERPKQCIVEDGSCGYTKDPYASDTPETLYALNVRTMEWVIVSGMD